MRVERIVITLPKDLAQALTEEARIRGRTRASLIRKILTEHAAGTGEDWIRKVRDLANRNRRRLENTPPDERGGSVGRSSDDRPKGTAS